MNQRTNKEKIGLIISVIGIIIALSQGISAYADSLAVDKQHDVVMDSFYLLNRENIGTFQYLNVIKTYQETFDEFIEKKFIDNDYNKTVFYENVINKHRKIIDGYMTQANDFYEEERNLVDELYSDINESDTLSYWANIISRINIIITYSGIIYILYKIYPFFTNNKKEEKK